MNMHYLLMKWTLRWSMHLYWCIRPICTLSIICPSVHMHQSASKRLINETWWHASHIHQHHWSLNTLCRLSVYEVVLRRSGMWYDVVCLKRRALVVPPYSPKYSISRWFTGWRYRVSAYLYRGFPLSLLCSLQMSVRESCGWSSIYL